jgi:hypothetical protein
MPDGRVSVRQQNDKRKRGNVRDPALASRMHRPAKTPRRLDVKVVVYAGRRWAAESGQIISNNACWHGK